MVKKLWMVLLAVVGVLMLMVMLFTGCKTAAEEEPAVEETVEEETEEVAEETEEAVEEAAEEIEPITLKWSLATAAEHVASTETQKICDAIKEKTNGAVTIELFVANALGTEVETMDMMRMGSIFGVAGGYQALEGTNPELNGFNLPFLFENELDYNDFCEQYAMDNLLNTKVLNDTGLRTLGVSNWGPRHLTTKGIPVYKPSDLEGIKIRSIDATVYQTYIKALGGTPIPVAWAELYLALQSGVAAGQENPTSNIVSAKFYEVQDYLILTGHAQCNINFFCSEEVFKSLPAEYQDIIQTEFMAGTRRIAEMCRDNVASEIEFLGSQGMTVITKDELDYQAFVDSANKVIEETCADPANAVWLESVNMVKDWFAAN